MSQRCRIASPVGIYNLGNTCYINCILQCLLHCKPLQKYFLSHVGHDHNTCQYLRQSHLSKSSTILNNGKNDTGKKPYIVCMACEMDRLFLETFGNTIGVNIRAAMEESISFSKRSNQQSLSTLNDQSTQQERTIFPPHEMNKNKGSTDLPSSSASNGLHNSSGSASDGIHDSIPIGDPITPVRFLAAAWSSSGMTHLAGYEQRDAHEFLHAFLDTMGKHLQLYRDLTLKMGIRPEMKGNYQEPGTFLLSVFFCFFFLICHKLTIL